MLTNRSAIEICTVYSFHVITVSFKAQKKRFLSANFKGQTTRVQNRVEELLTMLVKWAIGV